MVLHNKVSLFDSSVASRFQLRRLSRLPRGAGVEPLPDSKKFTSTGGGDGLFREAPRQPAEKTFQ